MNEGVVRDEKKVSMKASCKKIKISTPNFDKRRNKEN
jgi:hypothetical protein